MLRQHQQEDQNEPRLQHYLNELEKPMAVLSEAERQEWRSEAEAHLQSLITAHEELGSTHEEAVRAALAQFGAPKTIGAQMTNATKQQNPQTRLTNFVLSCLACMFIPVLLAFFTFVLLYDYTDNIAAQSLARGMVVFLLLLSPALTGWLVGRRLPWVQYQRKRVQDIQGTAGTRRLWFIATFIAVLITAEVGLFWSLIRVLSEGSNPRVLFTDFLPGLLWLPITLGVARWRGRRATPEAAKE